MSSIDLSADLSGGAADSRLLSGLSPEQRERLSEVVDQYLQALEVGAPLDRSRLVEAHPDLAATLRVYCEELERLHDLAAGFGPAGSIDGASAVDRCDDRRLGDFRLIREVGRGGMGVVYEAWQISLARQVALKVLPFAAVLDGRQISRFKNEAQAAAQLHHPHIVPVFAIGVERGVHYYAMQFVDGRPLDDIISQLRQRQTLAEQSTTANSGLPTRDAAADITAPWQSSAQCGGAFAAVVEGQERARNAIRLMIDVAEALHAAHEYGVIHRDVKPSNLLLDGQGKIWITDFGLARCHAHASLTRTGDVVGTLRYMSPEQAAGDSPRVDQRTDVYSLGATLYELVALRPLFDGADGPALLRRIEQEAPQPLRRVCADAPASLDVVLATALAKAPADRYATAADFAADLRRVLAGEPTAARPATLAERFGGWARRHARGLAAATAASLLLATGATTASWLISDAKAKADRGFAQAEAHYRTARAAVDRFGARLAERLATIPGAGQVREELLRDTLRYYRDFVAQAEDDPTLRADIALTYGKIGALALDIGAAEEALAAQQQSRNFYAAIAKEESAPESQRRFAVAENNLGAVLRRLNRWNEGRTAFRAAIELQTALYAASNDQELARELASSHTNLGLLERDANDAVNAEAELLSAVRLLEPLAGEETPAVETFRGLAAAYNNLGALAISSEPVIATDYYHKAAACFERAIRLAPSDIGLVGDLALAHNNLGAIASNQGRFADAAEAYGKAIARQCELVKQAPHRQNFRRELAISQNNLGLTLGNLGRHAEAERTFAEALGTQESLVAQWPGDVELRGSLGGMHNNRGFVLEKLGRSADAIAAYERSAEQQRIAMTQAPNVERYRQYLSKHYFNWGRALRDAGRCAESQRVALLRRELWPNDPQRLLNVAEELAAVRRRLADENATLADVEACTKNVVETLRRGVAAGLDLSAEVTGRDAFALLRNDPLFVGLLHP